MIKGDLDRSGEKLRSLMRARRSIVSSPISCAISFAIYSVLPVAEKYKTMRVLYHAMYLCKQIILYAIKYLGYIARVFKRVYNQTKKIPNIRLIIVYTADVKKGSTKRLLDLGADKLKLTEAFLSEMNAESILTECEKTITNGEKLQPIQKLRLMLCPLSQKGKDAKRDALRRVVNLVRTIEDAGEQKQILTGMIAFTDKIISQEDAEEIRRILNMTKVGRLIYEEQERAIHEDREKIAENLINKNYPIEDISSATGLELSVVEKLAVKISEQKAVSTV